MPSRFSLVFIVAHLAYLALQSSNIPTLICGLFLLKKLTNKVINDYYAYSYSTKGPHILFMLQETKFPRGRNGTS